MMKVHMWRGVFVLVLLLGLCACGGSSGNDVASDTEAPARWDEFVWGESTWAE